MPNSIEHERQRWGYMTTAQLERRLDKIKNTSKIINFAQLAFEAGNDYLLGKVKDRARSLGIMLPDYQFITDYNERVRKERQISTRNQRLQEEEMFVETRLNQFVETETYTCGICGSTFDSRNHNQQIFVNPYQPGPRSFICFSCLGREKLQLQEAFLKKKKPQLNANGQRKRRCKRI